MNKIVSLIVNWIAHKATEEELKLIYIMISQKLTNKSEDYIKDQESLITNLTVDGFPVSLKVQEYILKKEYLHAVKQMKDETGIGLKEAKDIVDKLRNPLTQIRYVTNK